MAWRHMWGLVGGLAVCAAVGVAEPVNHYQEVRGAIIPDWPAPQPNSPRLYVPATQRPDADTPLPQDALLPPSLPMLAAAREEMQLAIVIVQMGMGGANPQWLMGQTQQAVFLTKLANLPINPVVEDLILPRVPSPDPRYTGLTILLQTKSGRRFAPIQVFEGTVRGAGGEYIGPDVGRKLEYWLFGTARIRRDQMVASRLVPVITFEQCRLLGQRIVETTPRQCLLSDGNILLETAELPTLISARMTSFEQCLTNGGHALIYTFPRRCVAAGGRVFTEPPQVYETLPADAPVVSPTTPQSVSASYRVDATPSPTALQPIPQAALAPLVARPVSASAGALVSPSTKATGAVSATPPSPSTPTP